MRKGASLQNCIVFIDPLTDFAPNPVKEAFKKLLVKGEPGSGHISCSKGYFAVTDAQKIWLTIPHTPSRLLSDKWLRGALLHVNFIGLNDANSGKTTEALLKEINELSEFVLENFKRGLTKIYNQRIFVVAPKEMVEQVKPQVKIAIKIFCEQKNLPQSALAVEYLDVPSGEGDDDFTRKLHQKLQYILGDVVAQFNVKTYPLSETDNPATHYLSNLSLLDFEKIITEIRTKNSFGEQDILKLFENMDTILKDKANHEAFFTSPVFWDFRACFAAYLEHLLVNNHFSTANKTCLQLIKKIPKDTSYYTDTLMDIAECYRKNKTLQCMGHMLLEEAQRSSKDDATASMLERRILYSINALVRGYPVAPGDVQSQEKLSKYPPYCNVREAIDRAYPTFFRMARKGVGSPMLFGRTRKVDAASADPIKEKAQP